MNNCLDARLYDFLIMYSGMINSLQIHRNTDPFKWIFKWIMKLICLVEGSTCVR